LRSFSNVFEGFVTAVNTPLPDEPGAAEATADGLLASAPSSAATEKRPHPLYPDRWADGTTRPGFPGPALQYGPSSAQLRARREAERAHLLADVVQAITAPTPIEKVWARLFVEADQIAQGYTAYLDAQDGPIASRGRQRAAVAGRRQEVAQLLDLGTKLQAAIARGTGEAPGAGLREFLATREQPQP
jgi:hypothetical protein